MENPTKVLVTGAAGFIGYHLCKSLIQKNYQVVGLDWISDQNNFKLKCDRLTQLGINYKSSNDFSYVSNLFSNFKFYRADITSQKQIDSIFNENIFDAVCHLAALAGVRNSIINPISYIKSNIIGFQNIIDAVRQSKISNFSYASSSSVYGGNENLPYSTSHNVDRPVSVYAATKKSNELIAHTYSHLYKISTTGMRFFTVYGPWGRPDMAYFIFAKALFEGKPIKVFNSGNMMRDFTYIDDIIKGIISIIENPLKVEFESMSKAKQNSSYQIFNIGNKSPINLMNLISIIEEVVGKKFEIIFSKLQPGDVKNTCADMDDFIKKFNYKPNTPLRLGIENFLKWYVDYNNIEIKLNLKLI